MVMSAPSTSGLPILLLLGAIISIACLYGALRFLSRRRLIDDTPTSKAQSVFIGLVELKGTAESEAPLTSYLAGLRCVHYEWAIEEQWSRQVTETYHDANGKLQTRTRTESGWTNVGHGGEAPPFYLRDDTGIIRVVPAEAEIEGVSSLNSVFGRGDHIYYNKGPPHAVANSNHRRRFTETVIPLHSAIYIMGQARERQDMVAAEIAHDENAPLFVISTNTEKQISGGYGLWSMLLLITGLLGAVLGYIAFSTSSGVWGWLAPASLYILAAVFGWFWVVYNSLVTLRNSVDHAWALIDVQLKRRSDLIPNLVSLVEGYHVHEEDTQVLVAELRAQQSAKEPKGVAPMLMAVAECYPDLVAGEAFLRLQRSLIETEQRIALARDYFNEIVFFYNTRLVIMPDSVVGNMAGLRPRPLLKAEDFERAAVEVELAG